MSQTPKYNYQVHHAGTMGYGIGVGVNADYHTTEERLDKVVLKLYANEQLVGMFFDAYGFGREINRTYKNMYKKEQEQTK